LRDRTELCIFIVHFCDQYVSPGKLVIAIDGPAASGKSTTARLVAGKLGYIHVDTGAMYRAVTLKVLRAGIAPADSERIGKLLGTTHVALRREGEITRVFLDGDDVTAEIRTPEVTRAVSVVSRHRAVRDAMVREQRKMGAEGGIVLEGRDIGTVVFPDADLKFFMIAGIEARARRRGEELRAGGISPDLSGLTDEIRERDTLDSTRKESPLKKADDAIEIDTSDLTIEEQVRVVVEKVRSVMEGRA
jgi:cytidylate kinase